jgi:transcriptional activator SPT8
VDEGKRITKLQGHTSAVSVLNLAHDERSVLSGSWDKTVIDRDLNTGKILRKFEGNGSQISALETRPLSKLPVPEASGEMLESNGTLSTDTEDEAKASGSLANGIDHESKLEPLFGEQAVNGNAGSPNDSLFGGNDGDSLFGDNENDAGAPSGGDFVDEDDDFSRAIADGMREQAEQPDNEQEKTAVDAEGDVRMVGVGEPLEAVPVKHLSEAEHVTKAESVEDQISSQEAPSSSAIPPQGLPHGDGHLPKPDTDTLPKPCETPPTSESTFLAAAIDGSLRVWDKRQSKPIAKILPQNVPPWCMSATWSPDGNFIYAGRRNGTVDEYSLHKGLRGVERSFKLPNNSGPVSALRPMANGRHLIWFVSH